MRNNNLNTYLSNHFKSSNHSWEDVSIQIIDYVDFHNKSDKEIVSELNTKEDFYIRTLNTLHPLGLNDRVLGGGCVSQHTVSNYRFFDSPIPRRKRSHGVRKSGRRKALDGSMRDATLSDLQMCFSSNKISCFYRLLKSLSNSTLKYLVHSHLTKFISKWIL